MSRERDAANTGDATAESLRRDRFTLLLTSGVIIVVFALGAAVQTVVIYGLSHTTRYSSAVSDGSLLPRILANLACVAVALALTWALSPERYRLPVLIVRCLLVCVVAAAVRAGMQVTFSLYLAHDALPVIADFIGSAVVIAIALTLGLVFVASERRLRAQELANLRQRLRASATLSALQAEELRVRRQVAEGLHGTLQQRLVVLGTRLADITALLRQERTDATTGGERVTSAAREIAALADEVDRMREVDVRELSQLLYPAGAELGIVQAARMMIRRLPPSIAARITVDPTAQEEDAVPAEGEEAGGAGDLGRRILLLRVLEEGISNALRHGHASAIELTLTRRGAGRLVLTLDDNGAGLGESPPRLGGLALLADRLEASGGGVELSNGPLGGARLVAALGGDEPPAIPGAAAAG